MSNGASTENINPVTITFIILSGIVFSTLLFCGWKKHQEKNAQRITEEFRLSNERANSCETISIHSNTPPPETNVIPLPAGISAFRSGSPNPVAIV